MKTVFYAILGAVVMGCLAYSLTAAAFGGPVVFISHTTGGCAFWEDAHGRHDCSSAPKRAERFWIE